MSFFTLDGVTLPWTELGGPPRIMTPAQEVGGSLAQVGFAQIAQWSLPAWITAMHSLKTIQKLQVGSCGHTTQTSYSLEIHLPQSLQRYCLQKSVACFSFTQRKEFGDKMITLLSMCRIAYSLALTLLSFCSIRGKEKKHRHRSTHRL